MIGNYEELTAYLSDNKNTMTEAGSKIRTKTKMNINPIFHYHKLWNQKKVMNICIIQSVRFVRRNLIMFMN